MLITCSCDCCEMLKKEFNEARRVIDQERNVLSVVNGKELGFVKVCCV